MQYSSSPVAKLGPKAFEQCAGFMRITDGDNPLDATGVHPESYDAVSKLMEALSFTMDDVVEAQKKAKEEAKKESKKESKAEKAPKKEKQFVVKNTGSVFGAALAAALNGSNVKLADDNTATNSKENKVSWG